MDSIYLKWAYKITFVYKFTAPQLEELRFLKNFAARHNSPPKEKQIYARAEEVQKCSSLQSWMLQ